MPTFYCHADGAGPRECPDWTALYGACATEAALDAMDDVRAAEPGHLAQNGNGPRTSTLTSAETKAMLAMRPVERGSAVDAFGGSPAYLSGDEVVGRQLLCPVCLSPVYVCDAVPVPDGVPVVNDEVL